MIVQAEMNQLDIVIYITRQTIDKVYPSYYAAGAVELFRLHHSAADILEDIKRGSVYLYEDRGEYVGTITINDNKLSRLFVLPEKQKRGFGQALLDFSEMEVGRKHSKIILEASLPARRLYIKRGYRVVEYSQVLAGNGDVICYDIMEKTISRNNTAIDYEGRIFDFVAGTGSSGVSNNISFNYHQDGQDLKADYSGGDIKYGFMVGQVSMNGELDCCYQHITIQNEICAGKCHSIPQINANGKIELNAEWQLLNGKCKMGNSVVVER